MTETPPAADTSSSTNHAGESSSITASNSSWPLHKIREPHECNDVLLSGPSSTSSHRSPHASTTSSIEEEPIPWRSSSIFGNESKSNDDLDDHSQQQQQQIFHCKGNERFRELLATHLDDFATKGKMEQPLVTVRVLQAWRNQAPPGRFLVPMTTSTGSSSRNGEPQDGAVLWKDIGDKKARSRISKALKHLNMVQNNTTSPTLNNNNKKKKNGDVTVPSVPAPTPPSPKEESEEEKKSTEGNSDHSNQPLAPSSSSPPAARAKVEPSTTQPPRQQQIFLSIQNNTSKTPSTNDNAPSIMHRPKVPRFQPPTKNVRRISEQVRTAQQEGDMYYGRWKERDRLVHIYKQQRQRYLGVVQQQQQQLPLPTHTERPTLISSPSSSFRATNAATSTVTTTSASSSTKPSIVVDFILISGTMGVGKTSLAHTLKQTLLLEGEYDDEFDDYYSKNHKGDEDDDDKLSPLQQQKQQPPFFLTGKYEHCKWEDPNTVFFAVINDFCQQLLRRKDPLLMKRYRDAIKKAMRDDITLLTNLVPALGTILKTNTAASVNPPGCCGIPTNAAMDSSEGKDMTERSSTSSPSSSNAEDSYGCMAMQRVKQVLAVFFETIAAASPSHGIIILLDDLNYASEPALDILTYLVADKAHCGILFMGTFRTDEYKDKHFTNATKTLDASHAVRVSRMELENLEETSVHSMLAETLSLREEETQSLKRLVYSLTKGNPTFINELLRNFQDKGILQYDESSMQWTCDMGQISLTLGAIDGVPDLFKAKILAFPPAIQETLKIAACLMATEVDEKLLKIIDTVGSVSSHLKYADMKGLLKFRNDSYYFVSDGVKEAIYNLIPDEKRPSYHMKIGQRLWLHLPENQNSEFYSILMTQMMMGDSIITQDEDRRALALLYLESGQKAAKHLGFQTAWYCLSRGIAILPSAKKWGRENYDISLSLHNTAIEVCYCNGEFVELDKLIDEVLENARTFDDTLLARSSQIYSLGSRNKQVQAIEIGLETLKELGEHFPCMMPSKLRVLHEGRKLKKLLTGLSDVDILQLPRMKDSKKLAAMQVLNHFVLYTVYTAPKLSALVVMRMIDLTVKHGISAISSMGFVLYGMLLCRFNYVDDGYRYGELGLKICNIFKKEVWTCRTWAGFYGTIYCRKHAVRGALEPLQTAYRVGMRTGDVEYAFLSACLEVWNGNDLMRLPTLDSKIRDLVATAEAYGQTLNVTMLKPLWQFTLNMMGQASGDPKVMQGELVDSAIEEGKNGDNPHFMTWIRMCSMEAAYFLGDYDLAATYADAPQEIAKNSSGAMDGGHALFFECMVLTAQARSRKQRFRVLAYVKGRLKILKVWAMHAPDNFLCLQYLIQAEICFLRGDRQKTLSNYRSAILHCREAGFLYQEALANERLGRSYLEWGDKVAAIPCLREARKGYDHWGGLVKVQQMDEEFGSDILKIPETSFRHSASWIGGSIPHESSRCTKE